METPFSKQMIYCNCVDDRLQFPCDVETIAAIQNNAALTAVLGNMVGADRVILCGCTGSPRKEGYVWIKSSRMAATGEILYYPGGGAGNATDSCHIHNEETSISIDNVAYDDAYTTRYLANGSSSSEDTYTWGGFEKLSDTLTLTQLLEAIQAEATAREQAIAAMKNNANYTFVRGMIMMWSGDTEDSLPEGWALCDGTEYTIDGDTVTTPDLRDRFVMGAKAVTGSAEHGDCYNVGVTGGATTHQVSITLTASDVPMHRHSYMSDSHSEGVGGAEEPYYESDRVSGDYSAYGKGVGKKFLTENRIYDKQGKPFTASSVDDRKTVTSTVNTTPPYYALAFIMKL